MSNNDDLIERLLMLRHEAVHQTKEQSGMLAEIVIRSIKDGDESLLLKGLSASAGTGLSAQMLLYSIRDQLEKQRDE
ncbi:hypothetical protein [Neptuniibacter sp. QD37_11]|uniref:hypothetical protein n=1 Tax=Neptuniibacter sp. QD37_11 TaxID=3398209 RepID=UPI0039F53AAB